MTVNLNLYQTNPNSPLMLNIEYLLSSHYIMIKYNKVSTQYIIHRKKSNNNYTQSIG